MLLVVALGLEGSVLPHSVSGVAALLAMAWISHAGGQGLLSVALGRLPAAFSSLVIFLEAIAAARSPMCCSASRSRSFRRSAASAILLGIYVARPILTQACVDRTSRSG